jgi:hypothetical protein
LLQLTTRDKHLSLLAIEKSFSNSRNKHIPSEKYIKKTTNNKIYVCLRFTNTSKEDFAYSVAYSNHKVGSATKLPLHINKGITTTPSCPKFNIYKNVKSFPQPHPSNLKSILRQTKLHEHEHHHPSPSLVQVFLASSLPPHQKQVSFQAATKQNKTTDKKKHKKKITNQNHI